MKYTVAEIQEVIDREGLGNAIDEVPAKNVSDPVLRTLWEDVQATLEQIREYVVDHAVDYEEMDEDEDDD